MGPDLNVLRGAQGERAITAGLREIDAALQTLGQKPDASFVNTDARASVDGLLEVKAMLLLRLGEREAAFRLTEQLRHSWTRELQRLVVGPEFLEWRWIEGSGTPLTGGVAGGDTIEWTKLESCRPTRTSEIPFLLRALGATRAEVACEALDILMDHVEHQGTTYEVTPHVVRALVGLLDGRSISVPGLENRIRLALSGPGLFRHVPKDRREWVSVKKNPIDGLLLGAAGAFKTLRKGVLHGSCEEVLYGGDRERGSYVDGKRGGDWTFFYASGAKKAAGAFAHGKRHGAWTEWHEDGSKKTEGGWVAGKKEGRWWAGGPDGRRLSIGNYKHDRRHGRWEDTWENGASKISEWKDGVQVK